MVGDAVVEDLLLSASLRARIDGGVYNGNGIGVPMSLSIVRLGVGVVGESELAISVVTKSLVLYIVRTYDLAV